jgi:hypothetical protein
VHDVRTMREALLAFGAVRAGKRPEIL